MKIEISPSQMNLILMAVEFGYKQAEAGRSLAEALANVYKLYAIEPPKAEPNG